METVIAPVDDDSLHRAAEVLRAGGLVAFPTETVYGLGANALDAAAVSRIFAAKGRPATNPVIVHVADSSDVALVAAAWPDTAAQLAQRFWPGPLTLVVPKSASVPDIVTAGGPTVAIRCPDHPVARALIRTAGVPVAAPSANRSTELSPTRAEHVLKSLKGRIPLILDGGPCPGGIESTVVDVTAARPRILRPGLITAAMLEAVCGPVDVGAALSGVARSPGLMAKHYSPRTPVVLASTAAEAEQLCRQCQQAGLRPIVVSCEAGSGQCRLPNDPARYARELYATLHELDDGRFDRLIVQLPPDRPEWAAVRDRLLRAAAKNENG
ncbi:MAG: L-threonylcarbamoyladenylate synthase [Gemmataceae bacterium]|nr:L-threonylcarbamoyladenylate synthase [Gemmata sp.]MDW8198502.1 L-threonylcarbamoyladenylate synthase [Gemmataceae bacterium]